jgi:ATP-dependent Zn protease
MHTDAQRFGFEQGVLYLAGPAAQKRARRGSAPGWVRNRSPRELVAFHEAGHCVVAAALSQIVFSVSIVPDAESGGRCNTGGSEEAGLKEPKAGIHDHTAAVGYAYLLLSDGLPGPGWRSVLAMVRRMRRQAEEIIEANWLYVIAVAEALQRNKELDRSQIERLIRGKLAA